MTYCYCPVCDLNFTSLSSYDKHLGKLIPDTYPGYEHKNPEDCGLVRTDRGISLPPPMRKLTTEEWNDIYRKEVADE